MKHTIVARVDNTPGVVSRISGMFTRRGYNIDSLVTGVTANPDVYHMTITVVGTLYELEQLIAQLKRMTEVIHVHRVDESPHVTREFMLIKVACPEEKRAELLQLADIVKCKVVGLGDASLILEITGDSIKLDSAVNSFKPYGIEEVIRSGVISIPL